LHDITARPSGETTRASEAVFKRLLDTAYATTHLTFAFTTDEQLYAEQLIVDAFNADAQKAGWGVRLEQFGPALPDILYNWNGWNFRPALTDAAYVHERWRLLGQRPPPRISLRLHHQSAKVKGKLVPAKQGPVISKPSDGIGWAFEYRPVGGLHLVGDMSNIKLKRGEWLSDAFTLLYLQGTVLRDAPLWQIGSPKAQWAERSAYQKTIRHLASQRWDRVLRKRVFWQNLDQAFSWSATEAEQAEIRGAWFYEHLRSASQWAYFPPYRPTFWNVRDYSERAQVWLKSGKWVWLNRQHGGPVHHIDVTPSRAILALWLRRQLMPPARQLLLERVGRLYPSDCWLPYIVGRRFDQSPSAYLDPALAPKSERIGGQVVISIRGMNRHSVGAKRYAALATTCDHYNAQHGSYLNAARLSRVLRERRSLNIPRETEARDRMVANMKHDFSQEQKVVA
jgi:hypothetical protein